MTGNMTFVFALLIIAALIMSTMPLLAACGGTEGNGGQGGQVENGTAENGGSLKPEETQVVETKTDVTAGKVAFYQLAPDKNSLIKAIASFRTDVTGVVALFTRVFWGKV